MVRYVCTAASCRYRSLASIKQSKQAGLTRSDLLGLRLRLELAAPQLALFLQRMASVERQMGWDQIWMCSLEALVLIECSSVPPVSKSQLFIFQIFPQKDNYIIVAQPFQLETTREVCHSKKTRS